MKKQKHGNWRLLFFLLVLSVILCACSPSDAQQPEPEEPEEQDAVILPDTEMMVEPSAIPHYEPGQSGQEGWVRADGKLFYLQDGGAVTGLRRIDGRYYYFDGHGVKAEAVGVDVSTYNENIDWDRVKSAGIDFAIIRVGGRGWTSGGIYSDLRCEGYLRDARKAGLKIGVYFYSSAICEAEAVEEADAALRVLRGRRLDLPVFYDVEMSGEFPKGRADSLSTGERTRNALAFFRRIESAGYRAGIYSGQYFYMDAINYDALKDHMIWMASYTNNRMPPLHAKDYQLWQFTDHANVDGISCGVDMSVMFSMFSP